MTYADLFSTLKSVDSFYKNLYLLFDDLKDMVKEKAYTATIEDLTDDLNCWIDAKTSEHRRSWVFNHNGRIRFAVMLVTTNDDYLRGNSSIYKAMCCQLARDPKFPLMLIYGVFEPRDTIRFNNDNNFRRNWLLNATLIDIQDDQNYSNISELNFGDMFTLKSKCLIPLKMTAKSHSK